MSQVRPLPRGSARRRRWRRSAGRSSARAARAAPRRRAPRPATSTYWPPTMPSTPVAAASSPQRGEHPRRLARLLAEEPDRLGEEPVAGEDRDVLAELDVRGRQAAAQLVVVHRRQVVVDQRVGVDQLDRAAAGRSAPGRRRGRGRSPGRAPGAPACRRPAASSASPPRGRRSRGGAEKRSRAEGGVDQRAQVLGVAQPRRRVGSLGTAAPPRGCGGWPPRPPRRRARPPRGPARRRARRSPRRPRARRRSPAGARRSRAARAHSDRLLPLAHDRAEDAVDEARRVGAAVLLGDLDRLVDRDLVGTSSLCSISYSATRMTFSSSGAIRSSSQPRAWRGDRRVELLAVRRRRPRRARG